MALVWGDRVLETTTTTGTGALTLAGAITGYQRFSAVCSTNDTVYYAIFAVDGSGNPSGDWETGLGTYSGTDTLTRTSVSKSSNSNNAVDFGAGTKWVMITPIAATTLSPSEVDERARDAIGTALVAGSGITITPDDGADTITISASGGGGGAAGVLFDPPLAADFGTSYASNGSLTLTDDADVGLLIDTGTVAASVRNKLKAVPAGDWWVEARIVGFVPTQNFSAFGLGVMDSGVRTHYFNIDGRSNFRCEHWNGGTYVGAPASVIVWGMANPFMRIEYTSSTNTYVWKVSANGKIWVTIMTLVNPASFTAPAYVGFNATYDRNSGPANVFSCPYWAQSW